MEASEILKCDEQGMTNFQLVALTDDTFDVDANVGAIAMMSAYARVTNIFHSHFCFGVVSFSG